MSVFRSAAKSGLWFALFKSAGQAFSWFVTLIVAGLLSPHDYGLMSIASLFTGYIEVFGELGLGAAIVQRQTVTQQEYSSNFWFSLMTGVVFAAAAFGLAYPTAWIFDEPDVIPVTQSISVLFIAGGLTIVPHNILVREMKFKLLGSLQLIAVVASGIAMLGMAYADYGVWTLLGGTVVMRGVLLVMVFLASGWRPAVHFRWAEVRGFLGFGVAVAGSSSLLFVLQKADVFVIGRVLGTDAVGLYTFARQLGSMPTDKIASMVNQVTMPVFARVQDRIDEVRRLYLKTTSYLAIVVLPLYVAGIVWSHELIRAMLSARWFGIEPLFQAFCVAQTLVSLGVINGAVHLSQNRPRWVMHYYLCAVLLMPPALYVAAQRGLTATVVPWVVVYPLLCVGWTLVTLRSIGLEARDYLRLTGPPALAALVAVAAAQSLWLAVVGSDSGYVRQILVQIVVAGVVYGAYLLTGQRALVRELLSLRRP